MRLEEIFFLSQIAPVDEEKVAGKLVQVSIVSGIEVLAWQSLLVPCGVGEARVNIPFRDFSAKRVALKQLREGSFENGDRYRGRCVERLMKPEYIIWGPVEVSDGYRKRTRTGLCKGKVHRR